MKRFIACLTILATSAFLTSASLATPPKKAAPKAQPLTAQGKIKAIAKTPRPGTVPYKDCLAAIELTGVKGTNGKLPSSILLYVWTMRSNKRHAASNVKTRPNHEICGATVGQSRRKIWTLSAPRIRRRRSIDVRCLFWRTNQIT